MEAGTQALLQVGDIVYCLAPSPDFAHDGICFAARRSGLYRSDDGGITWRSAFEALKLSASLPAMAVAVSPEFSTDRTVFVGVPGAILRSRDGGGCWSVAELSSPPPLVSALLVSPDFLHDGTLLAGTMEDGVFRSTDQGSHWISWNFGLLDLRILTLAISPDFTHDETLFAGTESGLFRSTNGGRAWREGGFPTEAAPVLSLVLSPAYARDETLFAGTESSGILRSSDRGRTWTCLGNGDVTGAVNGILLSPDFPARANILVVLDSGLLVSRDGGASWAAWKASLELEPSMSCAAAPHGLDPGVLLLAGFVDGCIRWV